MPYTVDPTDPTTPTNTQGATQGAEELRDLKAYIATLAGLGSGLNLFRRNVVIGGNFDTNPFQRGTSFVGAANGQFIADRWQYSKISTVVHDADQAPDAPTVAQAGFLTSNCLRLNVTTADAAVAAGDLVRLIQSIEGAEFRRLAQKPMAMSFWHKHTKTGTYCVALLNNAGDRCYIHEYTQLVSDAWERETFVIPASPSAGGWNYGNGAGLQIVFVLMAGTTWNIGINNTWNAFNCYATVNQVNSCDTIGNKFRIANVQLESGSAASVFELRSISDELLYCQRYFQKSFNNGVAPVAGTGGGDGEARWILARAGAVETDYGLRFPVRMRAAPTVVTYNPVSGGSSQIRDYTAAADCSATGVNSQSETGCMLYGTANGGSIAGGIVGVHWTAEAEL